MTNINYTITLTEVEDNALAYVAYSQMDWINNAVHARCTAAIEEIVAIVVQKCLENQLQIPSTREEMVQLAYDQGWIKTGADRQAEYEQQILTTTEQQTL